MQLCSGYEEDYYATVLIGRITGFACPSVRPSVSLSVPYDTGFKLENKKNVEKQTLV